MSVTSTGTKNEPIFASSGNPPTFAADLTALGAYAAEYGNHKVGTTTQRNAFTPWEGLIWYDTTLDFVMAYTGAAWITIKAMGQTGNPFAQAAGRVATGTNTTGNTIVTFPASRFSVTPIVGVTLETVSANCAVVCVNITSSQMEVKTFVTSTGVAVSGVAFSWSAKQMTSAAAAG